MSTRIVLATVALTMTVAASARAGQREEHQGAAASDSAQAALCQQAQAGVAMTIDAALKRLDEARQTNSMSGMRAANDDLQTALLDVRRQLAPCVEMQAAADGHAGHTMPNAPSTPAAAPTPDAHAGHSTTATPSADAHAGHSTTATPAPDAHTGHAMPHGHDADAHTGHAPPAAAPAGAHEGHTTAGSPPASSGAATDRALLPTPTTSIADLKCGKAVDAKTAPRMLYQGRMYYFCSEQERAQFAKDPGRYRTTPADAAPHAH